MNARWNPDWDEGRPMGPEEPAGEDFFDGGETPDLGALSRMAGRSLRRVIERVDMETLSQALRDADQEIVGRVMKNLSSRTSDRLRARMESLPFGGPEAAAEARKFLFRTISAMEKRGEISLDGPVDDAVPPLERELEEFISAFIRPDSDANDAVSLMAALSGRGRDHGLLSLEPALERIPEGVVAAGLRAVVDQIPVEEVEALVARQIDSYLNAFERNGEIAAEGALSLFEGLDEVRTRQRLVAFLPEGEADYEKLPEVRLTPSAQAANDLISDCCRLAASLRREGIENLEELLTEIQDPLLCRGVGWLLGGYHIDEAERMLKRRGRTRVDRERRRLEVLLEGLILVREGEEPERVREALEGFLEEKA